MKTVPKLRFKEFGGNNAYQRHLFRDIFLFSTGKNIKQNEASHEFAIPCVRYGELYHMYGEVIDKVFNRTNLNRSELTFSQGDEILLPSAGEDPLDIGSASALTIENVAIGRTINILRPIKNGVYSHIYVAYYINQKLRKKISTLAKGVSISNVYNSDLKTLEIVLPSLPEQQKIASFLSSVDTKIQQLTKKKELLEQYKKGVMQKIFKQEIRFKDKSGKSYIKWQEKRLVELCEIKKGEQLNSSELTNVGDYPALNGGIGPSGFTTSWNTKENTITISEGGNSCGFINYMKQKFWSGGHCYTLHSLNKNVSTDFLYQVLKYNQPRIMRLRVGSGLPNIQKGALQNFRITMPKDIEEQSTISDFLKSIDNQINLSSAKLEETKQFKKGLLQQIFV